MYIVIGIRNKNKLKSKEEKADGWG